MNGYDDDDDGVSGCEGYYIASREGFLGGGSFIYIYIYIYIYPYYLERGRGREEGKERGCVREPPTCSGSS